MLSLSMWNAGELSVLPRLEWREQEITRIVGGRNHAFRHIVLLKPLQNQVKIPNHIPTNQWRNPKSSVQISEKATNIEIYDIHN